MTMIRYNIYIDKKVLEEFQKHMKDNGLIATEIIRKTICVYKNSKPNHILDVVNCERLDNIT
jgi:hypothetical protein